MIRANRMPMPAVLSLSLLVALTGCHGSNKDRHADRGGASAVAMSRPATQPSSFTGTLRGSAAAIGGETTGWRLEGDGQTGGIDLDVSKVRRHATALDGKRVTVTGKMTSRSWPERGKVQVLVADTIEEAPAARR